MHHGILNDPDPTDPIALTRALVRCPSVTPAEGGAITLLDRVLTPLGFTVHRMTMTEAGTPDVENLYARLGATGPNLCFAGHTDVVPPGDEAAWSSPPFAAEHHGGHIVGRGTVDMKGAIACFVAAVARLVESRDLGSDRSISLLITGDEEGPSINGTVKVLDWLAARGERIDACIVGEPSNPEAIGDEIKVGRRGSLNAELIVTGRQGHAAYPERADTPVPKLIRILDRLSAAKIDDGTADFQRSNLEVTVVTVPNTVTNVIPAEARARFNVRYNDLWTRKRLEAFVMAITDDAAVSVDARYTLTFSGTGDVFLTKPGPLIASMTAAIEAVTGRTPRLTTGGGTSDARFIQAVCPVIEFGLVNATIHQVDERVAVADLECLTRIYRALIEGGRWTTGPQ